MSQFSRTENPSQFSRNSSRLNYIHSWKCASHFKELSLKNVVWNVQVTRRLQAQEKSKKAFCRTECIAFLECFLFIILFFKCGNNVTVKLTCLPDFQSIYWRCVAEARRAFAFPWVFAPLGTDNDRRMLANTPLKEPRVRGMFTSPDRLPVKAHSSCNKMSTLVWPCIWCQDNVLLRMSQTQHNFPSLEAQMQSKEEMGSEKARSNLIADIYKIRDKLVYDLQIKKN